MAARELQGWHPDPFGLHEMRYFSVGRPTKLVRDGRVDAYDEPPADASSASLEATAVEATAVDGQQAVIPSREPVAAPPGASVPVAAAVGAVPPKTTMPARATTIASDPAAPTRIIAAVMTDQVAAPAMPRPVARPPRRRMEYAFVAAGAVVAVLVFVALGGGASKPSIAPAAFVTHAAEQTLAQHTADFTLSATAQTGGETMAMGGLGQIDIATGDMSFNVGATTAGGSIAENELEVGGNIYLKVTVNGHGLPLGGGRQWIELPFLGTAPQSFAMGSPESSLAVLSQQGAHVTPLGSRSIGGQNCNGYGVTPSTQAMVAGARQAFARLGLPAADTNSALQSLHSVQPPTITAWFASKTNLTCQVTVNVQFGAPTSSATGSVQAELTFTHYGVPVTITAPPASETIDLQQYLKGITKA